MRPIDEDLSLLGRAIQSMNVDETYRRPFLMAGQEGARR
jgi:hypothetical protein